MSFEDKDTVREIPDEVRSLIERRVQRARKTDGLLGVAVTLLIAGSIGAMGLAVNASAGKNLAESERALCERVLSDRRGTIKLREAQVKAAREIAGNPKIEAGVQEARLEEAKALQESIDDLRTRVGPENGGSLVCADEFPDPGIF